MWRSSETTLTTGRARSSSRTADGTGERRLSTSAPPSFFPGPRRRTERTCVVPGRQDHRLVSSTSTDAKGRHSEIAGRGCGRRDAAGSSPHRRWYSVRRRRSGLPTAAACMWRQWPTRRACTRRTRSGSCLYPGGEPRKITTDLNNYAGMSMTASGVCLRRRSDDGHLERLDRPWQAMRLPPLAVTTGGDDVRRPGRAWTWTPDGRYHSTASLSLNGSLRLVDHEAGWIRPAAARGERRQQISNRTSRADGRSVVIQLPTAARTSSRSGTPGSPAAERQAS